MFKRYLDKMGDPTSHWQVLWQTDLQNGASLDRHPLNLLGYALFSYLNLSNYGKIWQGQTTIPIMWSVSADYWSQAADQWKEIWQDIKF